MKKTWEQQGREAQEAAYELIKKEGLENAILRFFENHSNKDYSRSVITDYVVNRVNEIADEVGDND